MNDTELDELLNTWKTPEPSASLRERVRTGIAAKPAKPPRRLFHRWRWVTAAAAVAAAVLIVVNTSAFSEKPSRPPYMVDSEITLHNNVPGLMNAGYSGPQTALMTSYNQAGTEVLLSWSSPDHPFQGAAWTAVLAVHNVVGKVTRQFLLSNDVKAERELRSLVHVTVGKTLDIGLRDPLLSSGCHPAGRGAEVIGQEVLLNYPTVVTRHDYYKRRVILWMAPDLSCFALRARVELEQPDGSWKLESEKEAVKVTMNP
jgi:hypothetical protein